ncbi:MAG: hypothetical protein ABFR63_06885 [Thermodesulfobacteriota bacterium]
MTIAIDSRREIGWNGVRFSCPGKWESIVLGDSHLLFEDDFQPVLELRWQRHKKKDKDSSTAIARKLQRESGLSPQQSVPLSWQELRGGYKIQLLTEKKQDKQPRAALITCRTCGTTFLLSFFEKLPLSHPDLTAILSSLQCHDQGDDTRLWSIQDFRILLPHTLHLSSHSFAAGLSRLSFNDASLTMHLCRISSAAQRLEQTDLTDLMFTLGDITVPKEDVQRNGQSVSHSSQPSIFAQIVSRCKRKAPFHRMVLRHHPHYDRLSGLFFFDKKPIPDMMVSSILDSYELFPS